MVIRYPFILWTFERPLRVVLVASIMLSLIKHKNGCCYIKAQGRWKYGLESKFYIRMQLCWQRLGLDGDLQWISKLNLIVWLKGTEFLRVSCKCRIITYLLTLLIIRCSTDYLDVASVVLIGDLNMFLFIIENLNSHSL